MAPDSCSSVCHYSTLGVILECCVLLTVEHAVPMVGHTKVRITQGGICDICDNAFQGFETMWSSLVVTEGLVGHYNFWFKVDSHKGERFSNVNYPLTS